MFRSSVVIAFFTSLVAASTSPVWSQSEPKNDVQIAHIRVGFEGKYRVGYWTPVRVTVRGPQTVRVRLELTTADGEGVPARFLSCDTEATELVANEATTITGYAKFGRLRPELHVRVVSDANQNADAALIHEQTFLPGDLPAARLVSQPLAVTVGKAVGVEQAARSMGLAASHSWDQAVVEDAAKLPDRWFGYEGVSTLILTTRDRGTMQRLDERKLDAIHQWIQLGGKLILCVGANGRELLGDGGRLQRWSPGEWLEVTNLRRTTGLESFCTATEPLDIGDRRQPRPVEISLLKIARGRVDAYEGSGATGDAPVVVRMPLGLGQVTFVAFDPEVTPVADWSARPRFIAKLLEETSRRGGEDEQDVGQANQPSRLGYDDMTGQLRGGLDQFSSVPLVPFSWMVALAVGYLVVLGPGDFLFWRWLGRPGGTWLTLPLIVGLGSIGAVALARHFKSDQRQVNRVDMVDVDYEERIARGTTWLHLYSPRAERLDVALRPHKSTAAAASAASVATASPTERNDRAVLLSWQGLPGHGLGGMYGTSPSPLSDSRYEIAPGELRGLPFAVASTRGLAARWHAEWPNLADRQLLSLRNTETRGLTGRFGNPLPFALRNVALLHERAVYSLERDLQPGESLDIADFAYLRRDLERLLTRRQIGHDNKDVSEPWDDTAFDVQRICEVMMFYEAAGGASYTRLTNRFQANVDLTEHLRLGRAILWGRADAATPELTINGQPVSAERRWTFFRLVIPVEKSRP